MNKFFAMLVAAFVLSGCGQDASQSQGGGTTTPPTLIGEYTSGKRTLIFSSDGQVTAKGTAIFPGDKTTTYKIEGGKVHFHFPEGSPMSLAINSDDSLSDEPLRDFIFKKIN